MPPDPSFRPQACRPTFFSAKSLAVVSTFSTPSFCAGQTTSQLPSPSSSNPSAIYPTIATTRVVVELSPATFAFFTGRFFVHHKFMKLGTQVCHFIPNVLTCGMSKL
jgi:hypothetical protein